jgi:hypothetical protein
MKKLKAVFIAFMNECLNEDTDSLMAHFGFAFVGIEVDSEEVKDLITDLKKGIDDEHLNYDIDVLRYHVLKIDLSDIDPNEASDLWHECALETGYFKNPE